MKKIIFLDRDGCIINEADDEMLNEIHKVRFLPKAITSLHKIATELDYLFVMITNQDGLGTDTFPEKDFWPLQEMIIDTLANEGVHFDTVHIDTHYAEENSPYRKPGTMRLKKYMSNEYDLANSFVIGDRWSDIELAKNLGAQGILIQSAYSDHSKNVQSLEEIIKLQTDNWNSIYNFLIKQDRLGRITRTTKETDIQVSINLDGTGLSEIDTGIGFYDHMLEQLSKHGQLDLVIKVKGDLEIDEHHTIEDTAIALGQAFKDALGKKAGIARYGFCLPMDDVLAQVAVDFGGRPWLEWNVEFKRERIGEMPTEMFYHFFKSFADHADCNLNMKAEGDNEHHKIEALYKAWAHAIRMAVKRNADDMRVLSTKGSL